MIEKGRFIFDKRPCKKEELDRLILLSKLYQPYMKEILLDIKNNTIQNKPIEKIIDIGAGTGHTTLLLKKLFPSAKVTYFDYSLDLLNYAKNIVNIHSESIDFKHGDIDSYDFGGKYDFVFSRFALKHFFNPISSIKVMTNILNNKGFICLVDKDVYANIWYPKFPLYKTKLMYAINKYNRFRYRGGDSMIGRKMRYYLLQNNINIKGEKLIVINLNRKNSNTKDYKNAYISLYENLVPELVNNKLISYKQAKIDIQKLKDFINDDKNTAIIIDFVIWGEKNE